MPQDRDSGRRGAKYGPETARKLAKRLCAEKIGNEASNEYRLGNKTIVIKCARRRTNSVGVTYHMLDTLSAIWGAFETKNGTYDLFEMEPNTFREIMRPTRSRGASAGRVGKVTKTAFVDRGKFVTNIEIEIE